MLNNGSTRYHRRIDERPGSQNASRIVVGGGSVAAVFAYKLTLTSAVCLFTVATLLASSRSTSGVEEKNGNAKSSGFVCNLGNQISERPVTVSCPLSACDLCLSDVAQIFQSNRPSSVVRLLHNTFGNTVIGVFLIPRLTTGDFPEFPFCRAGLFSLKIFSAVNVPSPLIFNLFTRERLAIAIHGEINDANIYAQNIGEVGGLWGLNKARGREIKFTLDERQIGLTNLAPQEFQLMFSGNKRNLHASRHSPNRDDAFVDSPREQVFIIFDCSKWSEYALDSFVNFVRLSNLRGTTNNDARAKILKPFSCLVIRGLVEGELRENSQSPCLFAQIIATFVGDTNCLSESLCLLGCSNQLYFCS